jgi:hypothetical protein
LENIFSELRLKEQNTFKYTLKSNIHLGSEKMFSKVPYPYFF